MITSTGPTIIIIRASSEHLPAILGLFDDSVRWLVERGLEGQWGTTPISELPKMKERLLEWIEAGEMYVALAENEVVGSIALSEDAPEYAAGMWESFPESALYLEAFTTARSRVGHGVGQEMLRWAEEQALARGKTTIWLDCWADNPSLCAYYERAGYEKRGTLGSKWRAQLFEKTLAL
jgi:GNAT superfamily N-acetyltransferase